MRNVGLDLLRILAVLLVICRHLDQPENASLLLRTCICGGWVGVDLFFVLSGFLVSSLLFREYQRNSSVSIKRFLIRRAFKIYPAFWLFLFSTLLLYQWFGVPYGKRQILSEILFVQNYFVGIWNHTWSLAVEEHFYIGLSLLVVLLLAISPSNPFRRIPLIFALTAASCLSLRMLNFVLNPVYTHSAYMFGTHIRIDSLMFGVLLSYCWNFCNLEQRIARVPSWLLVSIAVTLLAPAFMFPLEKNRWVPVFGVILFYLGSGLMLLAAIRWKTTDAFAIRFAAGLGAASYSIYLWHMPVSTFGYAMLSKAIGTDNYYLYLFHAFVGSCLVGWILNRLLENPMLMLRDRWFPSDANPVSMTTQREPVKR